MSAYNIISIGDAHFLERILNFVAMFGNAGLFLKIGLLGALIGLILILVKGAVGTRQLELGSLLFSVALFLVFFGYTTTVTVEDYYTGQEYVVDNVPFGTAILGHVISTVGVAITDKMQQGLGDTQTVTIPPQYALTMLRRSEALTSGDLSALSPDVGSAARTLIAFENNCYQPAVRHDTSAGGRVPPLSTATDALGALVEEGSKFGSSTNVYQPSASSNANASGMVMTCKDAGAYLTRLSNDQVLLTQLQAAISGGPDLASPGGGVGSTGPAQAYTISDAMGAIQAQTYSNRQLLWNMVLANVDTKAQLTGSLTNGDVADSAMIEQAMARRNVQYASEQSVFLRSMRAIMTFFEGLAYGLAPFLAFLIPIGLYGMKLAMRYFQLLFWIFLWMPIMSFVNLFEIMSVQHQMDALPLASSMPGLMSTMQGIVQAQYYAGDWIALGGWLTTGVIGVAGMIVYGSIAAFNQIASSAHGPDMIDEGVEVPQLMNQAPLMSEVGAVTFGPGMAAHNPNLGMPKYEQRENWQNSLNYQRAWSESRDENLARSMSHGRTSSLAEAESLLHHTSTGINAGIGTGTSQGASVGHNATATDNSTHTDSASHRTDASAKATAYADAHAGGSFGPLGGASVGIKGEASLGRTGETAGQDSAMHGLGQGDSAGTNNATYFATHKDQIYSDVKTLDTSLRQSGDTKDADNLSHAYSEAYKASETLQSSQSESSMFGSRVQYGLDQVASGLSDWSQSSPDQYGAWERSARDVAGNAIPETSRYTNSLLEGATGTEQRAGAMFAALDHVAHSSANPEVRAEASRLMAQGMSATVGGFGMDGAGPIGSRGQSLQSEVIDRTAPVAAAAEAASHVTGYGGSSYAQGQFATAALQAQAQGDNYQQRNDSHRSSTLHQEDQRSAAIQREQEAKKKAVEGANPLTAGLNDIGQHPHSDPPVALPAMNSPYKQ